MLDKEYIINLLKTNDKAVARALVVLTARQTADEQSSEHTRYLNGRGYRPCHARMGTSMSKFFERNGYLSPKQLAYWRATDRSGSMRIGLYWGQLIEEANNKAARKAVAPLPGLTGSAFRLPPATDRAQDGPDEDDRDFGNDMERRMVLQEHLDDVMDSDDPALIEPIAKELDEIDAFWEKIRSSR